MYVVLQKENIVGIKNIVAISPKVLFQKRVWARMRPTDPMKEPRE